VYTCPAAAAAADDDDGGGSRCGTGGAASIDASEEGEEGGIEMFSVPTSEWKKGDGEEKSPFLAKAEAKRFLCLMKITKLLHNERLIRVALFAHLQSGPGSACSFCTEENALDDIGKPLKDPFYRFRDDIVRSFT